MNHDEQSKQHKNAALADFTIVAPSLPNNKNNYNDAMVLGSVVWLWMQSKAHRNAPLSVLPTQLMPALQNKQFVLMFDKAGQPIFYLAWAWFDAATEVDYFRNGQRNLTKNSWNQGDRIWVLDFIAPFGQSALFHHWTASELFANTVVRHLYHKGWQSGLRVYEIAGKSLTSEQARQWSLAHPILADVPVRQYF